MKSKITLIVIALIITVGIIAGTVSSEKFIAYDESVATGDSVVSGWVYVGANPNVALFYNVGDTADVDFTVRYRYGQTNHVALSADSLATTGSTLTGKSRGKVLRGYGLATDLIPGANFIYVHANAITGQTNSGVKIGLITSE